MEIVFGVYICEKILAKIETIAIALNHNVVNSA